MCVYVWGGGGGIGIIFFVKNEQVYRNGCAVKHPFLESRRNAHLDKSHME